MEQIRYIELGKDITETQTRERDIYPREPSKNSLHYLHVVILTIAQRRQRTSEGTTTNVIGHLWILTVLSKGNGDELGLAARDGVVRSLVVENDGTRLIKAHVVGLVVDWGIDAINRRFISGRKISSLACAKQERKRANLISK